MKVLPACAAFVFLLAAFALPSLSARAEEKLPAPRLVENVKLWDAGDHNAFTDLLHHEGLWYCVFREGSAHVSPDGAIRVLVSEDGEKWESRALITHPVEDLRDAKIAVTPDGRLMLNGAGMQAEAEVRYRSFVWFSSDQGKTWTEPAQIGDPGFWLWRATWRDGYCYSMGYRTDRDRDNRIVRFYRSRDGVDYEAFIPEVNLPNGAGEDAILFGEDGSAFCLFRYENGDKMGRLGKSEPPYDQWTWQTTNQRLGGPQMIRLPDGRILAASRFFGAGEPVRTSLAWLDPDEVTLTECLALPSGGDTSYPGLVWKDGLLWVSYYSSHEGKTNIYLAKVAFE